MELKPILFSVWSRLSYSASWQILVVALITFVLARLMNFNQMPSGPGKFFAYLGLCVVVLLIGWLGLAGLKSQAQDTEIVLGILFGATMVLFTMTALSLIGGFVLSVFGFDTRLIDV